MILSADSNVLGETPAVGICPLNGSDIGGIVLAIWACSACTIRIVDSACRDLSFRNAPAICFQRAGKGNLNGWWLTRHHRAGENHEESVGCCDLSEHSIHLPALSKLYYETRRIVRRAANCKCAAPPFLFLCANARRAGGSVGMIPSLLYRSNKHPNKHQNSAEHRSGGVVCRSQATRI
jgi:hypothetical protein